ncbi:hypothetical protein ID866_10907, partial [Astraeus odoratus]
VDTLVDKVQIFGAKGFLPKPVLESEPAEDELQEALWEGWMQKEEEALTKHLKSKGKESAKEKEQEAEDQRTGDEEGEGAAE